MRFSPKQLTLFSFLMSESLLSYLLSRRLFSSRWINIITCSGHFKQTWVWSTAVATMHIIKIVLNRQKNPWLWKISIVLILLQEQIIFKLWNMFTTMSCISAVLKFQCNMSNKNFDQKFFCWRKRLLEKKCCVTDGKQTT